MNPLTQTTLLRIAAFIVDVLSICLVLILPASILSYTAVWFGGSMKSIALIWYGALAVLVLGTLFRDGRGRSPGKRILGLRLATDDSRDCSFGRSLVRNLPLVVPGWNLIEIYLVLFGRQSRRSGDRIAGTSVIEE